VDVLVKAMNDDAAVTRADAIQEYSIDIGVRKKVANKTPAELDPLVLLMQELREKFPFNWSGGGGLLVERSNEPVYAPEVLREQSVFLSVLTLTFSVL